MNAPSIPALLYTDNGAETRMPVHRITQHSIHRVLIAGFGMVIVLLVAATLRWGRQRPLNPQQRRFAGG
jgi:hypothetical protein